MTGNIAGCQRDVDLLVVFVCEIAWLKERGTPADGMLAGGGGGGRINLFVCVNGREK